MYKAFTDYPLVGLGDVASQPAPIRVCTLAGYDGDKYCEVAIDGGLFSVKRGYIYRKPHRCGEGPCITHTKAMKVRRMAQHLKRRRSARGRL